MHVSAQYIRIKRHLAKDWISEVDIARRMNGQVIRRVEGLAIFIRFCNLNVKKSSDYLDWAINGACLNGPLWFGLLLIG